MYLASVASDSSNPSFKQFPMHAWRSTTGTGWAHLANQGDDFRRHGRSTQRMTTLPAPVQSKSSSMPGDHRFRFDDHQVRSPAAPELGEPNPQKSVSKAQARSVAA